MDMRDYRSELLKTFESLKTTPMFETMAQTVEASPWHREANVLVHTEMVVGEYVRMTDELGRPWTRDDFLGGIACVFHDTGKPASKIQKFREDRGHYFAFHGHESVSSRMFETYACSDNASFAPDEIFKVCWMIEHHMPWEIAQRDKRLMLAKTALYVNADVYVRALLADQLGRIADDAEAKNLRAREWIDAFKQLMESEATTVTRDEAAPLLYMLIGASGSGKSTTVRTLKTAYPAANVFSLDDLRHEWYNNERSETGYADAFAKSVEDPQFASRADAVFIEMLREGKHVIVDNVNATTKRRNKYLTEARKRGYQTVAITMPIALQEVIDRQQTRGDKSVPEHAVRQQYASIQQPSYGEFDAIIVSGSNLPLA